MKDLIDSVLNCTSAPENWERTLDAFSETFQISSCCMFSVHEFREYRMNFHWGRFFREALTPEVLEMMQSGGDVGDQPAYKFLFDEPAQKFYAEPQMFHTDSWEDLPPSNVRDIVKGYGFNMRTASVLNKVGPWMDGFFCQHRSDTEWQPFLADSRTEFVLPVIASSVSLGRTLQALRSRYQASLSVLDALGLAVLLVDVKGNVISYNKEAQRLVDQKDGLSLTESKKIKLRSAEETNKLNSMINAANGLLRGDMRSGSAAMASSRPSGAYQYLISVRSLADTHAELEPGLNCAFVTIIDPERKNALSVDGIAALGDLSPAESEVANLLIQGLRVSSVAARRDVSTNTVKTQVKAISQKLRCSNQSDIIRVAAATRLPIDD